MNAPAATSPGKSRPTIVGVMGGIAGAVAGWYPAVWVMEESILGSFLIGALMGIGARWALGRPHPALAAGLAAVALGLALACHWRTAPFATDPGFLYFLGHLSELGAWSWVDVGFGTFLSFRIVSLCSRESRDRSGGCGKRSG